MKKKILFVSLAVAPLLFAATFVGYGDWQLRTTAGSPASGYLRMWADSSAGKFLCKTSAGAACYFDSATSGSVSSVGTTSPITGGTITTTGTIACVTCVTSSSPGAGIAHFAGSTQAVTSSAVSLTADVTGVLPDANIAAGVTRTIASGTSALGTSAISSAACATVVTTSATGTASTDAIQFTPNGSIKAITGYVPATTGGLTIAAYPTANNVNFDVCNWSSGSLTPGALTLNWRVVR